jgi:HNH/ENDO VII superfamily nuclease
MINRPADPGYQPGMQRHHLLPRQLLAAGCFAALFERVGRDRVGFDDFRHNGMLLPSTDSAAVRIGLPLHRGPHRIYNAVVFERVGQIERGWAGRRQRAPEQSLDDALMRLGLLQRALRRRLLSDRRRLVLNRADPLGSGRDFAELDAMADLLWRATSANSTLAVDPQLVVNGVVMDAQAESPQLIEADVGIGRPGIAQSGEFGGVVMPGEQVEQARKLDVDRARVGHAEIDFADRRVADPQG